MIIHGNPSGVDNAVGTWGEAGFLFRKYIWCYVSVETLHSVMESSEYCTTTFHYHLMIICLMILISLYVGGMLRFLAGKIIPLSRYWHWFKFLNFIPYKDSTEVYWCFIPEITNIVWLKSVHRNNMSVWTLWSVCSTSRVPLLRILLTNTKVPRSTKVLVARVKDRINKVLNGSFLPRVLHVDTQ